MSFRDIYDFEGIVEGAVAAVFTAGGVAVVTSISDPELQKVRPRIEVTYQHGPGMNRFHTISPVPLPDGMKDWDFRRESAWRGTLKVDVVTASDPVAHRTFRAKVRSMMANVWTQINEVYLPNHKLQFAGDGGTTPTYRPEEGVYASSIIYNTDLSVQADAWPLLDNNDE